MKNWKHRITNMCVIMLVLADTANIFASPKPINVRPAPVIGPNVPFEGARPSPPIPQHFVIPPTTDAELNAIPGLSGILYDNYYRHLHPGATSLGRPINRDQPVTGSPDPTFHGTTAMSSDANADVEPTVTVNQGKAIVVGTKYVSVGSPYDPVPENYYYSDVNYDVGYEFTPPVTTPGGGSLVHPWTGDPTIYPGPGNGTYGNRVYACALVGDDNANDLGIAVWYSDNAGGSWTLSPHWVAFSNVNTVAYDKPTITVSWYPGYDSYVFVSYMQISGGLHHVMVARSSDGGQNWDQSADVADSPNQLDPVVMVAAGNGYVYTVWAEYSVTPQQIRLARSPAPLSVSGSWNIDTTGPTGNFVSDSPLSWLIHDNLRAATVPEAVYNYIANRIDIVWHEYQADNAHTRIRFASKGTNGWSTPQTLSVDSQCYENGQLVTVPSDHFMPAVDFDSAGNCIITWYDRSEAEDSPAACTSNTVYDLYFAQTDAQGNSLQGSTGPATTWDSDPADDPNPHATYNFIGDYQGVWYDSGANYAAWIGTQNAQPDVYRTLIW